MKWSFFKKKSKETAEPLIEQKENIAVSLPEPAAEPEKEIPLRKTAPCGDSLFCHVEGDTLYIEGYGETDADLLRKACNDADIEKKDVHRIVVGEGCTKISANTFYGWSFIKMTELQLPESLQEIGKDACHFYMENGMQWMSIPLPGGLKRIGDCAFFRCVNLQPILLPAALTEIGAWAFCGCKAVKELVIPAGVRHIKEGTFYGCTSLRHVRILGEGVTIEERAFANCPALEMVEISGPVTKIEKWAFHGSKARFLLPKDLKPEYVDPRAFDKCTDPVVAKFQRLPTEAELQEESARTLDRIRNCPLALRAGAVYVWNRLLYDGILEPEYMPVGDSFKEEIGHNGQSLDSCTRSFYDANGVLRKRYSRGGDMFFFPEERFGLLDTQPILEGQRDFPFYTDGFLYNAEGSEIRHISIVGTASSGKPALIGRVYLLDGGIGKLVFEAEAHEKIRIEEE